MGTIFSRTRLLPGALIGGWLVVASAAAQQPVTQRPAVESPAAAPAADAVPVVKVPPPPSQSEIALACASTLAILEEYAKETNLEKQAAILERADERIRSVLSDPRVESLKAWRIAGVIASIKKDVKLGAFAFEAIERLKPDYASDSKLLNVMGRLDAMGVSSNVQEIKRYRPELVSAISKATTGESDAMYRLAQMFFYGKFTATDRADDSGSSYIFITDNAKAQAWTLAAATAGHVEAMVTFGSWHMRKHGPGIAYLAQKGIKPNDTIALMWLTQASERGDATAKWRLGVIYNNGEGVVADYARACELFNDAMSLDRREPTTLRLNARRIAEAYQYGNELSEDKQKAAEWFLKAASDSDADAARWLCFKFAIGDGVLADDAKSVEWLSKAEALGQDMQTTMLQIEFNKKDRGDEVGAAVWAERAANRGCVAAMYRLAQMHEQGGKTMPRSQAKAYEWYSKAAGLGSHIAQNMLGIIYLDGRWVAKNYEQAARWFQLAADQGNSSAQYNLGTCYESGRGVPKDKAKAVDLYRKAAKQGDDLAKARLRSLGETW